MNPATDRYAALVATNFEDAVAACADMIEGKRAYDAARGAVEDARQQRGDATTRRDRALWRLANEDHVPVKPLPRRLHDTLAEHFTDDEIKVCGLSYSNVRLIVEKPAVD